jgi:predicted ATPase/DNA-binding SARP family transcriptional activator
MRVGILGGVEIARDGGPADPVGGGRLRALLARLALDPGRPVGAAALADAVWDGNPPADPVHALQSLVSRLRGVLGDAALITPAPGGGYRLAVAPDAVDAARFERLAAEGGAALAAGDPGRAAPLLAAALDLWRGPALAGLEGLRFAAQAADVLEDRRLAVLADRVEAETALGRGAGQLAALEAAAAAHPLNERLAGLLLRGLYGAGRQADALAAYERTRAALADELGVGPSPELGALHMAALRGELDAAPGAAPAPPPPGSAPGPEPARPARRSNLTAALTSFVGREAEVARIGALLRAGRLVTLVGPGGAGKTRLARETVAPWVDAAEDGVWFVALAPIASEVEVLPTVLAALELREAAQLEARRTSPGARDSLERLLDVLRDREVVLVLDNCEHLVAAAAELTEELLAHCPRVRVLATSREALGIAGEQLAPVPPLGLPAPGATPAAALEHPAIRLFADRAGAVDPTFAVDERTVGAVIEICARLDGLPLAIELAAARLRSLPVDQIAARLDDRFRLLTGGARTALPRHRTLRAVVDWSWDLLEEPERRLARRLAVFAAGATVESASAICGEPGAEGDVLDGLAALVDRSLVQADGGRYRMLETIREYGLERLEEAGEADAVRDRHAAFFAALAHRGDPELRGPDQVAWFRRLDAERDNILAALRRLGDRGDARATLRLAIRLIWFWTLTGAEEEARTWIGFARAVPGEADPLDTLVADAVAWLGDMRNADLSAATVRTRLVALSGALEDFPDEDEPLLAVAKPIVAMLAGEDAVVERRAEAAMAHRDPWVRATASMFRGAGAENDGDTGAMVGHLADALAAFRAIGDRWGIWTTLTLDTGRLINAGDLEAADAAIAEAQRAREELTPGQGNWVLGVRRADIALRRGDLDAALAFATEVRDARNVGTDERIFAATAAAGVLIERGDVAGARAQLEDAAARLDRGEPFIPQAGHGRAIIAATATRVALAEGDLEGAQRRVAEAAELAAGTRDMPLLAHVGLVAAVVAEAHGRAEQAAELLGAAEVLRGAADAMHPDVVRLTARLRAVLGEHGAAALIERGRARTPDDAVALVAPGPAGVAAAAQARRP